MSEMDALLQEIRGLRQDVQRNSTGFASGNMTGQAMRDQAWSGITNAGTAAAKLSTGSYDLKAAIEQVTGVFKIFGGVGEVLGTVFGATINHVKEMNDAMIASGRNGVTFSQNLFSYTKSLADAGISFNDFNKLISSANKQMFGVGVNAQQSASMFLQSSEMLMKSRSVLAMNMMGVHLTEFQDQLVITTDLFKNLDRTGRKQEDVSDLLAQATISATIEIDNMARMTGRSRQEIQKDIDQQQNTRLARMAKLSMDEQQLANMNRAGAMLANLPQGVSDLYVQLVKFKTPVTRESAEQLKALDLLAPGLEKVFRQMSQARDAQEQERLRTQFEFLYGKAISDPKRMTELAIMPTISQGVSKAITELAAGDKANYGLSAGQMYRESGGNFARFTELQQADARMREDLKNNILKTQQAGGAGAVVSQILQLLDRSIKAGPQAVANFMKSFEEKAGEKLEGITNQGLMEKVMGLQNMTAEQASDYFAALTRDTSVDTKKGREQGDAPTDNPRYGATKDKPLHVEVTNTRLRVDTSPDTPANPADLNRGRLHGSANATGPTKIDKWFENFGGMPYNLHDDESVVRRDQSVAFAMDALTQNGMLPAMAAGLRTAASNKSDSNDDAIRNLSDAIAALPAQFNSVNLPSAAQATDDKKILAELLDRLNSKMETLINTVEDGSKGTVKAVRSQNNLIG